MVERMGAGSLRMREAGHEWLPVPAWVSHFIDLGYCWPQDGVRRIAVVSAPCDSAAAGLMALGAMVRRLEEPNANDLEAHTRRILDLRPGHRGTLRRIGDKSHYVVHHRDQDGSIWLESTWKGERRKFLSNHASDWRFDGEAPVEVKSGEALPWQSFYGALLTRGVASNRMAPEPKIWESNLCFSDSSIVLAGRSTGESAQAEVLCGLSFLERDSSTSLLSLLSLQNHQPPGWVSRIRYLNPRASAGAEFDRQGAQPRTVIADGSDAFLFVLSFELCSDATIIGHIPRTDDQGRLEEVGEGLAALRQWYEEDAQLLERLPSLPRGVVLAALRARDAT